VRGADPPTPETHARTATSKSRRSPPRSANLAFTNPVLIDEEDGIIAGSGRVLAAHVLGLDEVPCIVLAHLTPTQRRAYVLADNKLGLNAGWDLEMLSLEIGELGEAGFDLSLTGFDEFELGELFAERTQGRTDPDDAPEPPAGRSVNRCPELDWCETASDQDPVSKRSAWGSNRRRSEPGKPYISRASQCLCSDLGWVPIGCRNTHGRESPRSWYFRGSRLHAIQQALQRNVRAFG
jgi:hypothetical protein